jgi:hypothetical protein
MQKATCLVVAISFLLVTACGRVGQQPYSARLSEQEAVNVLSQVQNEESMSTVPASNAVTVQGLESLIQDLVQSGQVKVPSSGRGAILSDGSVNTDSLNKIITMISQGMSAFQVAKALIQGAGSTSQAKFDLDSIAAILQAALPFIVSIAPQFAPVVQAVLSILPVIKAFFAIFKKPATTAAFWVALPARA